MSVFRSTKQIEMKGYSTIPNFFKVDSHRNWMPALLADKEELLNKGSINQSNNNNTFFIKT
ncbi:hypothetical protein EBO34_11920 [Alteribacter keqinensis]|uniref:Uncharacterized protein n=1 Tax=Alteribacter keqinensis TaxID=2483800 RepID=A0A3M7TPG2_9BACI|nr:hypothetical protein EBO34_11920 [Alteribacter keqinensis]